jgi:hypothetical protein
MGWGGGVTDFSALGGKVLVEVSGAVAGSDHIEFRAEDGTRWELFHRQDCCESVSVTDVNGDVADLIGHPLLLAEEASSVDLPGQEFAESFTWTLYRLRTIKGSVEIRWYGESNGYYSESVDFERVTE